MNMNWSIIAAYDSYPGNPRFQFIVNTSTPRTSKRDRQIVKSHAATRGSFYSRRRRPGGRTCPKSLPPGATDTVPVTRNDPSTAPRSRQDRTRTEYMVAAPARINPEVVWVEGVTGPQRFMVRDALNRLLSCPSRSHHVGPSADRFPLPRHLPLVLASVRTNLYPPEVCSWDDSPGATPLGFLIHDPLFVHTALFTTEAVLDMRLGRPCSVQTGHHLVKTLGLLQKRVAASDNPLAVADQTIVVVVTLALTAEALDDQASMANHVEGLQRMVSLRGGFARWKPAIDDLPSKVCRADLSFALRYGRPPLFLGQGNIPLSHHHAIGNIRPSTLGPPTIDDTQPGLFPSPLCLDNELAAIWHDLQSFTAMCNTNNNNLNHHETTGDSNPKLPAHVFSETIASILYRLLTGLSFSPSFDNNNNKHNHDDNNDRNNHPLNEAVRIGMTIFAATASFRGQRYDRRLLDRFGDALFRLRLASITSTGAAFTSVSVPSEAGSADAVAPPQPLVAPVLLLWLLVMWDAAADGEAVRREEGWADGWVDEVVWCLGVWDWDRAREMLGSVMWIGSVYDAGARVLLEGAFARVGWRSVGTGPGRCRD